MAKKIRVIYNGCLNLPREHNHTAKLSQCKAVFWKQFDTAEQAIDFWFECTSPITDLEALIPDDIGVEEPMEYKDIYSESMDSFIADY